MHQVNLPSIIQFAEIDVLLAIFFIPWHAPTMTELNRPIAIPAFSPDEWEDWRRTNIDGHDYFGVPHECWRITTDYSTALIEAKGGVAIVTRVALRDFLLWCKRSSLPYDANSRAQYAAFLSLNQ